MVDDNGLGIGADHDILQHLVEPVALLLIEVGIGDGVCLVDEMLETLCLQSGDEGLLILVPVRLITEFLVVRARWAVVLVPQGDLPFIRP